PITKNCAPPASTTAASCRSRSSPPGSITSIAWRMRSAWAATDHPCSVTGVSGCRSESRYQGTASAVPKTQLIEAARDRADAKERARQLLFLRQLDLFNRNRFAAAVLEDLSRRFHPLAGKLHQSGILSMRRNSILDGQQQIGRAHV